MSKAIVTQPRGFDLFRLPGLRRFIRWRYARLVFQLPLLVLAIFAIIDGFTGRDVAPRNVATTTLWLHYRGLVVFALALVGNAFCAACPLMLTRGATRWLGARLPRKLRWPGGLRNKYLVAGLLLAVFFSYELFDLWASPWLTAWLVVAYFVGALAIDTLFPAGTFCRFVCPLGNFNFAYATASPTQITAIDHDICRSCEHKPCLHGRVTLDEKPAHAEAAFIPLADIKNANGKGYFPGCETDLFVPTIQSNMDCTNCFNCVRACPYDNVALSLRLPGWEWTCAPWKRRGRLPVIMLGVLLAFWGLLNASAMVGPSYALAQAIGDALNSRSEALVLGILFAAFTLFGLALTTGVAWLADLFGGARSTPLEALMRWGYIALPLGFGFWAAHYLFHFLTGALSIVPVFEHFFWYRGWNIEPNWRLAQVVPTAWLFPISAALVSLYTLLALTTALRIALRDFGSRGVLAMWPPLLYILLYAGASLLILGLPMEMRGTLFMTGL
ncbi:hypothetical protein BH24DEI1_BH24DEI1_18240 [soil metagenome]